MKRTKGPFIPMSGYQSSKITSYSGTYFLHRPDRRVFKVLLGKSGEHKESNRVKSLPFLFMHFNGGLSHDPEWLRSTVVTSLGNIFTFGEAKRKFKWQWQKMKIFSCWNKTHVCPRAFSVFEVVSCIVFISALEFSILVALMPPNNESALAKSFSDLRDELRSGLSSLKRVSRREQFEC